MLLRRIRVIDTSEARTSGAFSVTGISTSTCNSIVIKNLVKIFVKCLECLAPLSPPVMLNIAVDVKISSYLYDVMFKKAKLYIYIHLHSSNEIDSKK